MAHVHSVYDNDTHFKIDAVTRTVRNVSETKAMVVQHDHNSERFTFEIPRTVDGHDMSTCNIVQVHYINTESKDKTNTVCGVYEVDDLQICPEDDDVVICSWLISGNATRLVGNLSFIVRFVCSSEAGVIDYAWNTAVHSNVFVTAGINNGEQIVDEYADVLEAWREELFGIDGIASEVAAMKTVVEGLQQLPDEVEAMQEDIEDLKQATESGEETTVAEGVEVPGFTQGYSGVYTVTVPMPLELVGGASYRVVWDNTECICICYTSIVSDSGNFNASGFFLGNAKLVQPDLPDTGERFFVMANGDSTMIITSDAGETHVVSLYLTDRVATEAFVRNYIEQYINEALGGEY